MAHEVSLYFHQHLSAVELLPIVKGSGAKFSTFIYFSGIEPWWGPSLTGLTVFIFIQFSRNIDISVSKIRTRRSTRHRKTTTTKYSNSVTLPQSREFVKLSYHFFKSEWVGTYFNGSDAIDS